MSVDIDLSAGLTQVLADTTTTYLTLAGRIAADSTAWTYYHGDGLGSVRAVSDATGQPISAHGYSPYGDPTTAAPDDFGYTGEQVGAGGLVFLRARYYDPGAGVFLSHDPWSGDVMRPASMNGWSYVEGNPVRFADPSGACASCYVFFFGGASFPGDWDGNGTTENELSEEWRELVRVMRSTTGADVRVIYPFAVGTTAITGESYPDFFDLLRDYGVISRNVANIDQEDHPVIRAKVAEIVNYIMQKEFGVSSSASIGDCHYWQHLTDSRLGLVSVDMVGYSAGGNIAYYTAVGFPIAVDDVVLLGAPHRTLGDIATEGKHPNIGTVWSMVAHDDSVQRPLQAEFGQQVGVNSCVLGTFEINATGGDDNPGYGHGGYADFRPIYFSSIDCEGRFTNIQSDIWWEMYYRDYTFKTLVGEWALYPANRRSRADILIDFLVARGLGSE